ncbi:MAG: hypothetical protein Q4F79_11525 [Eubacteriales bacterium]|nr:hypothetical protein [Eubacteriales bacterium]
MKLMVQRPHRPPIWLVLPNRLLFGRFSAWVTVQALRQHSIAVDSSAFYLWLRRFPYREWKGLPVVEVRAADGTRVKITL